MMTCSDECSFGQQPVENRRVPRAIAAMLLFNKAVIKRKKGDYEYIDRPEHG